MRKVVVSNQQTFIVLTALHVLSACIVLANEFLAIDNMVPGGNFPIEHQFSWTRVLLFCGVAIASALVLWTFSVKKDAAAFLPSLKSVLSIATFATLVSVLFNYASVTGWCCEVYPTRYFGFPFSYLHGDRLIGSRLILAAGTLTSYRLYFPLRFFLDLLFWSNTFFIILSLIPFLIQQRKAGEMSKKDVPAKGSRVTERVTRLFLAVFFGVVAGVVAFFFPARPAEPPVSTPMPFLYTPTSLPTPNIIFTPSDRFLALISVGTSTPALEQTPVSTSTPAATPEAMCPPIQPAGAAVGQIAMVRLDPSIPSQVREQPALQSTVLGQLRADEFFIILDGPQCADGYIWWKVQSARGLLGWIPEGYVSSYWLVTPTPISTKPIDTPTPPSTAPSSSAEGSISPTVVSVGQLHRILPMDDILMSVAWSPDGGYLASSNTGGIVWIWDWAQGQQLPVTSMGEMSITNADGASDRKWIFSAEARYVRHEPNGKLLAQTDTSGMICLQIRWSPNRRLLLGRCNDDSSIFIWDAATGEALQRIYAELVTDIAWSPNGQQIASSSSNGTLRIWDVISGHQVNMLRNEAICEGVSLCGIESIAWSPDGSEIAFGDRDPKIKTWNLTSGHVEYIGEAAYSTPVHAVAWSPDGRRLASINGSGIQVWGLSDGLLSYVLDPGNLVEAYGVAWSPNGKYLAVAGRSRSVSPRGLIWIWSIP